MSKVLEHYAGKEVQKALLESSKNKEVAIKYGEKGFGKRPDTLYFENDILDLAKSGATSFHISEELWKNPLQLKPGMTKKQLDEIRTGWDLIIDIDSKHFEIAKKAAILFIDALKFHDIKNLSVKFSGNNGFHIGIPFESFPDKLDNIPLPLLFPDGPKMIASYLKEMIREHLTASILSSGNIEELMNISGKTREELTEKICKACRVNAQEIKNIIFRCPMCKREQNSLSKEQLECPDCRIEMKLAEEETIYKCPRCSTQDEKSFEHGKFNPFSLVDIDTILISTRHLFRAPYSVNEKSGLISLPINPEDLPGFKKEHASLRRFKPGPVFLDRSIKAKEAEKLLTQSYDFWKSKAQTGPLPKESNLKKAYLGAKIPAKQEHFPPCIKLGLSGMEDGKKRFLFILINFLGNSGYDEDTMLSIINEWNKKNPEPLRDNYIQAQLSWSKRQRQKILPPNCDNPGYYKGMQICKPDSLCRLIKNPVNYTSKAMNKQQQSTEEKPKPKKERVKELVKKAKKSIK